MFASSHQLSPELLIVGTKVPNGFKCSFSLYFADFFFKKGEKKKEKPTRMILLTRTKFQVKFPSYFSVLTLERKLLKKKIPGEEMGVVG